MFCRESFGKILKMRKMSSFSRTGRSTNSIDWKESCDELAVYFKDIMTNFGCVRDRCTVFTLGLDTNITKNGLNMFLESPHFLFLNISWDLACCGDLMFCRNFLSNSLTKGQIIQYTFLPIWVVLDLSFTYALVSSKSNNWHLLLKCSNSTAKHFSPVQLRSRGIRRVACCLSMFIKMSFFWVGLGLF